jgi:hypothetical protein
VLQPTYDYDSGVGIEISDADDQLIAAAPDLLAALRDARNFIQAELDTRLDSFCTKGPDGKPDISTLDDADGGHVGEAVDCLARIDAAITLATGAE